MVAGGLQFIADLPHLLAGKIFSRHLSHKVLVKIMVGIPVGRLGKLIDGFPKYIFYSSSAVAASRTTQACGIAAALLLLRILSVR